MVTASSRPPCFFWFANNLCKIASAAWSYFYKGLSPPLSTLSRWCPTCNGVKSGLRATSESSQNLSLLESLTTSPPPHLTPPTLTLFKPPALFCTPSAFICATLSHSSLICMRTGCFMSWTLFWFALVSKNLSSCIITTACANSHWSLMLIWVCFFFSVFWIIGVKDLVGGHSCPFAYAF